MNSSASGCPASSNPQVSSTDPPFDASSSWLIWACSGGSEDRVVKSWNTHLLTVNSYAAAACDIFKLYGPIQAWHHVLCVYPGQKTANSSCYWEAIHLQAMLKSSFCFSSCCQARVDVMDANWFLCLSFSTTCSSTRNPPTSSTGSSLTSQLILHRGEHST